MIRKNEFVYAYKISGRIYRFNSGYFWRDRLILLVLWFSYMDFFFILCFVSRFYNTNSKKIKNHAVLEVVCDDWNISDTRLSKLISVSWDLTWLKNILNWIYHGSPQWFELKLYLLHSLFSWTSFCCDDVLLFLSCIFKH